MTDAAAVAVFDQTIIDYLRVTSDKGGPLREVLRGPTERVQRGLGLYSYAERDGYGTVYCADGPEGGRFMLQLSGKPLAAWRADRDQRELVSHLGGRSRCTRIDLARDTSGDWTPYRLREYLDADRYVSTWKKPPVYTQERNGPLTVRMNARLAWTLARG